MNVKIIFLLAILSIGACKSRKKKTEPEILIETYKSYKKSCPLQPKWVANSTWYSTCLDEKGINGLSNDLERIKSLAYNTIFIQTPLYEIAKKEDSINLFQNLDKINTKYGTEIEIKKFVKKAHEMGFKIAIEFDPVKIDSFNDCDCNPQKHLDVLNKKGNFWINKIDIDGLICSNIKGVYEDQICSFSVEMNKNKEVLVLFSEFSGEQYHIDLNEIKFDEINKQFKRTLDSNKNYINTNPKFVDLMNVSVINLRNFPKQDFIFYLFINSVQNFKTSIPEFTSTKLLNELIANNSALKPNFYVERLNNIVANQSNVVCYKRCNKEINSNEVIFILNLSNKPAEAGFVDLENYTNLTEYFSGKKYDDLLSIDLKPMEYLVFVKK